MLTSRFGPAVTPATLIEEEIRTLPSIIEQPWDILRGDKFDVLDPRNRQRQRKKQGKIRILHFGPRCATFSRIREIPVPGNAAGTKLRSED